MDAADRLDDWLAGDLDPAESAQVERRLAEDPALAAEAQRRRARRGLLPPPPAPAAPDQAQLITRRAAWERARPARPRHRLLLAAAGLAGLLAGGALMHAWDRQRGDLAVAAWSEDGRPLALGETLPSPAAGAPPSFGVAFRPLALQLPDAPARGHLVLQVAPGSPAERAGLRPGDVLLLLDECPMLTPDCIRKALAPHRAGDRVALAWWSASEARQRRGETVL